MASVEQKAVVAVGSFINIRHGGSALLSGALLAGAWLALLVDGILPCCRLSWGKSLGTWLARCRKRLACPRCWGLAILAKLGLALLARRPDG